MLDVGEEERAEAQMMQSVGLQELERQGVALLRGSSDDDAGAVAGQRKQPLPAVATAASASPSRSTKASDVTAPGPTVHPQKAMLASVLALLPALGNKELEAVYSACASLLSDR